MPCSVCNGSGYIILPVNERLTTSSYSNGRIPLPTLITRRYDCPECSSLKVEIVIDDPTENDSYYEEYIKRQAIEAIIDNLVKSGRFSFNVKSASHIPYKILQCKLSGISNNNSSNLSDYVIKLIRRISEMKSENSNKNIPKSEVIDLCSELYSRVV